MSTDDPAIESTAQHVIARTLGELVCTVPPDSSDYADAARILADLAAAGFGVFRVLRVNGQDVPAPSDVRFVLEPPRRPEPLLILASGPTSARYTADDLGLARGEWRWVADARDLFGRTRVRVCRSATAWMHPKSAGIDEMLRVIEARVPGAVEWVEAP